MLDNITNITVCNDSVNIYNLYMYVKNNIFNTNKKLKKLSKELDIAKGGPKDVQAQQYDKIGFGSNVKEINDIFKQVKSISDKINELNKELDELIKTKQKIEETIREVANLKTDNLEVKVFIGRYIEGKSLKQLSFELYRLDSWGIKQLYTYQYLRLINSKIKKQIG